MGDEVNGSSDGSKATSNSGGGAVKGVTETASAWLLFQAQMGKGEARPRHGLRSGAGKGVGSVIGTIMIITAFWWFHSRAMRARKREATKGAERIV